MRIPICPYMYCQNKKDKESKMGNPNSKDQCSVNSEMSANDDFVTVKSYNGETKHGKRHGHGVYMYPNGDIYDGEWRKSRKYGRGVYKYADGQRLEGYFYHDDYIGKEPNGKIKRRMAKKKGEQADNCPIAEQNEFTSNGKQDETAEPRVKLKADDASARRALSMKRTKWLRDKYNIHGSTESLDTATRRKNTEEIADNSKNVKRSFSFGSKKQKNANNDFNEAAERKNSKRLRESIRQKYNLKGREQRE